METENSPPSLIRKIPVLCALGIFSSDLLQGLVWISISEFVLFSLLWLAVERHLLQSPLHRLVWRGGIVSGMVLALTFHWQSIIVVSHILLYLFLLWLDRLWEVAKVTGLKSIKNNVSKIGTR